MGLPPSGSSRVTWTAPVAFTRVGSHQSRVTVALAEDNQPALRYLAVPIARDAAGALAVSGYPAWVGAPPLGRATAAEQGEDVEDPRLRRVVTRFLTNYLRGARENAQADLLPGAQLSLPPEPLRLDELLELTDAGPNPVRVVLTARASGRHPLLHTLAYELRIARRDRPYVEGLLTTQSTRSKGATP